MAVAATQQPWCSGLPQTATGVAKAIGSLTRKVMRLEVIDRGSVPKLLVR